jgi:hypothetical protein
MANVKDLFYHGIRQQVREVVTRLGNDRTDEGLTAFEDGHSSWADCFFARALRNDKAFRAEPNEFGVARTLGFFSTSTKSGLNVIPVRIVYMTFDGMSTQITKAEMRQLITDLRDESRPDELMRLLRNIDYSGVEDKPAVFGVVSCA